MRVEAPQEVPGDGWVAVDDLVGRPTRPRARKRALTPEQVDQARELAAQGRSLRSIICELEAGSHESLRQALREPATALAAD